MSRRKKEQADKLLIKTLLDSDSDEVKVKAAKEFLKVYLAESKYLLLPQRTLPKEKIHTELDQIFEDVAYHPASGDHYWVIRRSDGTHICWIAKNENHPSCFGISPEASKAEGEGIRKAGKEASKAYYEEIEFKAAGKELKFVMKPPPYKE